jgi:bacillithiol biosynthesis cysteine-adding enzyme BshC
MEAVPVFWMATEDHDLAEVNHCYWLGRGGLVRYEIGGDTAAARPVGEVTLDAGVSALARTASDSLEGEGAADIAAALRESYRPGETLGSAFARLFVRLFAGHGLILLDPQDTKLHQLAAPLFRRVVAEHAGLTAALLARGKALVRAGFHAQVKVTERSTPLFVRRDGQRLAVRAGSAGFTAGEESWTAEELLALAARSPESFSGNALLRPVVQDMLLPTAAYIAGPAEIAYFAQSQVLYQQLLGRMPCVLPRAGFTLVEAPVARLLKRYGLELTDVFAGRERLRRQLERQSLAPGLERQFAAGEKGLRATLRKLGAPLRKLDTTLAGALDTAERKMLYQFLKLQAQAGRARNFRTGVLDRHEQQITEALFPHHGPQERALSLLPLLARHGLGLLDALEKHSNSPGQHAILTL